MKIIKTVKKSQDEFRKFLGDYKIIELAIGVVIGNAVKDLVNSIANNLIMPIIGIVTPNGEWKEIVVRIGSGEFKIGLLMASVLDFLIVALVVFIVIKKILRIEDDKDSKIN